MSMINKNRSQTKEEESVWVDLSSATLDIKAKSEVIYNSLYSDKLPIEHEDGIKHFYM